MVCDLRLPALFIDSPAGRDFNHRPRKRRRDGSGAQLFRGDDRAGRSLPRDYGDSISGRASGCAEARLDLAADSAHIGAALGQDFYLPHDLAHVP